MRAVRFIRRNLDAADPLGIDSGLRAGLSHA